MNRSSALAASLVATVAVFGCASHHGEHDDTDVPVAMSELPAPVRATLDRESAGGKVTEVEKEMKNGHLVYSADVTANGQDWDIDIAEDGTLLSKKKEKAGEHE